MEGNEFQFEISRWRYVAEAGWDIGKFCLSFNDEKVFVTNASRELSDVTEEFEIRIWDHIQFIDVLKLQKEWVFGLKKFHDECELACSKERDKNALAGEAELTRKLKDDIDLGDFEEEE